mmetsp:Transcript_23459/g.35351  ORF Transcript_23459/g.35351 Transcript_23459/m.35351 type:complete len:521 (+) Transcript_23459:39-1601(+)
MMKIILAGILAFCATVSANNYYGGCNGERKHDCCAARRDYGMNSWQAAKTCDKYGCNRKTCNGYYDDDNYNDDDYKSGSSYKQNYEKDDVDEWGSPTNYKQTTNYNGGSNYNKNANDYDDYNKNSYNNNNYQDNFVKDVVYKSSGGSRSSGYSGYNSDYEIYTMNGQRAGYNLDGWEGDGFWGPKLQKVREECAVMFHQDMLYLAKAIRLVFHDCMGNEDYGCDGCVDLTHPDNQGLDLIMYKLLPIFRNNRQYFSRTDIWQICSLTALDISSSMYEQNAPHFKMTLIGRKDCPNADEVGDGGDKIVDMYPKSINSQSLVHHFYQYFGFDARCTTAVMGTHGMSLMHPWNSGHGDGPYPAKWSEGKSYILDNWYFKGFKKPWTYELRDNNEYPNIDPKKQWYWESGQEGFWNGDGYEQGKLVMLDADMSLKYDYSDYQDQNGYVYCKASYEAQHHGPQPAQSVPLCPMAYDTYDIVEEYAHDNLKFLYDVEYCMIKMFNTGYRHGMDGNYKMYYGHGAYY